MKPKKTSLKKIYQQAVDNGRLQNDPEQQKVISVLDPLWRDLTRKRGFIRKSFSKIYKGADKTTQGIYLWGPVGVGKSMLFDMLFAQVDKRTSRRFHFHDFMRWVQKNLLQVQGHKNPLSFIFKTHFSGLKLLFLDEFLVEDVTDALILNRVIESLLAHGVCFVTTSNTSPDNLYLGGMYRERFLPVIELIKKNNHVLQVKSSPDYRRAKTVSVENHYYFPCSAANKDIFMSKFMSIARGVHQVHKITLFKRDIMVEAYSENAIWFDFKVICSVPRSVKDYIALADKYEIFFVSDMPQLGEKDKVWAINFIRLIDVLYEKRVKLYIMTEVPMTALYIKGKYAVDFQRTLSRLIHMQSSDW